MERFEPRPKQRLFRHDSLATKALSALGFIDKKTLIEETALDTMAAFARAGFQEYDDLNQMYRDLTAQQMLVRREDPERIVESLTHASPMEISFPEGSRYSNAVEWDPSIEPESMDNAFLEGYGMRNGIVTVIGIKRDDTLDVTQLPDAQQNFYGLRRNRVVSIQGSIAPENIAFVIIRVPIYAYPVESMTDRERARFEESEERGHKGKPEFIARGFLNPKLSRRSTIFK